MKSINVPGLGIQECVLMRKAPEGEFDVVVSEDLASLVRDVVDDGSSIVRANQQEHKQKSAAAAIQQSILDGAGNALVVESPLDAVLAASVASSPKGVSASSRGEEEDDDASDEEAVGLSSLLASLLSPQSASLSSRSSGKGTSASAKDMKRNIV